MRHEGDIFSLLFSDRSRARIVLLIANRERDKQVRFDEVQCEGVCLSAFLNFLGFIWREMRMQMFRWWLLILTHDSKHHKLDTSFRNLNYSFCLLQVGKGRRDGSPHTQTPCELKMMFFVIVVVWCCYGCSLRHTHYLYFRKEKRICTCNRLQVQGRDCSLCGKYICSYEIHVYVNVYKCSIHWGTQTSMI